MTAEDTHKKNALNKTHTHNITTATINTESNQIIVFRVGFISIHSSRMRVSITLNLAGVVYPSVVLNRFHKCSLHVYCRLYIYKFGFCRFVSAARQFQYLLWLFTHQTCECALYVQYLEF